MADDHDTDPALLRLARQLSTPLPPQTPQDVVKQLTVTDTGSGQQRQVPTRWDRLNEPLVHLPRIPQAEDATAQVGQRLLAHPGPAAVGDAVREGAIGAANLGIGAVEGTTSPAGLAGAALSGGAYTAGRAGLLGLSQAARLGEAALSAPYVGHGIHRMATADSPEDAIGGALEAGTGLAGVRTGLARGTIPAGLFERLAERDAGFTVHALTHREPKGPGHFGVSVYPDRGRLYGSRGAISRRDIVNFTLGNKDLLAEHRNYVGAWHDPDTGEIYLDVSVVVPSRAEAERLARTHAQKAYYDFGARRSVPVGGVTP